MKLEDKIKKAATILSQNSANVTLYSTHLFDDPTCTETKAGDGTIIGIRRGVLPIEIDPEILNHIYEKNNNRELLLPLRNHAESNIEQAIHSIIRDKSDPVVSFQNNGITATKEFLRFVFVAPFSAYGKNLRVLIPHQGIENISWSLLRNTENVDSIVYNIHLTSREQYEKFITHTKIDLLGFSPLVFDGDFQIIGKSIQLSPHSLKLLGGPAVRHVPPEKLFEALDIHAICYGRGEEICAQMAALLKKTTILKKGYTTKDFLAIPNIALSIEGQTMRTEHTRIFTHQDIRHTEDIPTEQTDAIHRMSYITKRSLAHMTQSHLIDHVGEKRLVIEYTDHCKAHCIFCNVPRNTRKKSIDQLFTEIKENMATGEYDSIHFIDNTFSTYPKDIAKITQRFIDENLVCIPKACKLRTSETTLEMLNQLAKAGFTRIFYGIESFNDEVLTRLQKETTRKQHEIILEETIRLGMIPGLNLILPTPYDTRETITLTIEKSLEYVEHGATLNIVPQLGIDYNTPLYYTEPDKVLFQHIYFEGMKSPYTMPTHAKLTPEISELVEHANTEVDQRIIELEKSRERTVSIHEYSLLYLSALSTHLNLHTCFLKAEKLISA